MAAAMDASTAAPAGVPVPPQHRVPDVHDFRATSITKRGYLLKNKRKLDELEVAAEEEAMVVGDGGVLPSGPRTPATKRAKHNVAGLGKASGRAWKEPGVRAGSLKPPVLSTTWEQKMAAKAERAAFTSARTSAVEARKAKKRAAREKREAARARKEANTARSAVVQTITKASTLQRMLKSKKARKSLRKADTVQVS